MRAKRSRSDGLKIKIMNANFLDFWHLYAPLKEYSNRYLACKRLWESMDEATCAGILRELQRQRDTASVSPVHEKNPYFYLIDWQPLQPHWLSPKEVGSLLAQHIPLAVCRNVQANCFGTVTKEEAEMHGLEVHHYM